MEGAARRWRGVVGVCVAVAAMVVPRLVLAECGTLEAGQSVGPNQQIWSCSGVFRLVVQSDGNLVLYQGGAAYWSSGTGGRSVQGLSVQSDANVVLYDAGHQAIWSTHTNTPSASRPRLVLGDDGNLLVRNGISIPWSSNTGRAPGAAFSKPGNNGTVSCSRFCTGPWGGGTGACTAAVRMDNAAAISCDEAPGLIGAGLACHCTPAFNKAGNNGTVSCSTYCNGANWGGGTGPCAAAYRGDNNQPLDCNTVQGFSPQGTTCFCHGQAAVAPPPAAVAATPSSGTVTSPKMKGVSVNCTWQGASPNIHLACPGMFSLDGLSGTITSAESYELTGTASNVAAAFPGMTDVVDFANANLVTGLSDAKVKVNGPGNGNVVTIAATLGLGSAFSEFDEAVQGITNQSLMTRKLPTTVYVRDGVVTMDALLSSGEPDITVPETGTTFRVKRIALQYLSKPKAITVAADTQIKLSSVDSWATLNLKYTKEGTNVMKPSGQLQNLVHPFGVVPLSITDATFSAKLVVKGTKRRIKAMDVTVHEGKLFDYLTIGGSFSMDTEAKSFALDLTYRTCGQVNRIAVSSEKPEQVPGQLTEALLTIAKSMTSCIDKATCPAGYTKTGLQCDATCPAGATNTPGICAFSTRCSDYGSALSGAPPSCMNPSGATCPAGSTATPGFCQMPIACPSPLTGARPSCINPNNARPLIFPQ